jgi:hypothetical protein
MPADFRVRVKLLNDNTFLLHLAQDYPFMFMHKMLSMSFKEWINKRLR